MGGPWALVIFVVAISSYGWNIGWYSFAESRDNAWPQSKTTNFPTE